MTRRPHGAGSVYLHPRKRKWIAQLDLGTDVDGKRIRKSASAASKKEAQAKLAQLERDQVKAEASHAKPESTTGQYLNRWFEQMRSRWSPRTVELYRHQLDAHILPSIGQVPLAEIAPLHVQEMVSSIVSAGHIPTANKCRRQLFTALKQAVRWELIARNPVEAVDPVPEKRTELALWSPDQVKAFLTTHRGHRWFAAFYLLITSGLRRGELLGLRWEDVAEDGLHVRQTVTVVGDVATIGQPKTRRSSRFVALPPDTLAVLGEHRARQDASKALVGSAWEHPELVFPSEIGTVMHPRNFYRSWHKAVTDAGLPPARIHDMRHLHVSLLILKGEDAKVISDRAGHSSTSFTLDRYGHVFNAQRKRAAHSLDDLLGGQPADEAPPEEAE